MAEFSTLGMDVAPNGPQVLTLAQEDIASRHEIVVANTGLLPAEGDFVGQTAMAGGVRYEWTGSTWVKFEPVGNVASGIASAASGWTLVSATGRKKNGIAWVVIHLTRSGGTITVDSGTGDISNEPLATLGEGWVAATGLRYGGGATTGRVTSGYIEDADVVLAAVAGDGTNITNGAAISIAVCYPLA